MSYEPKMFKAVKDDLDRKRRKAIADAEARTEKVGKLFPEIGQVDAILQTTGLRILEAIRMGKAGLDARIASIKEENDLLLAKKSEYLVNHGLSPDYTDPQFACKLCEDTGYADGKMCTCFRTALFLAGVARSGLGKLPETHTFDNFSLAYYPDPKAVEAVYTFCRRYASEFSEKTK